MSNRIMLKKDKTVKVFNNQQQVADYLGVTKQAVAKAIKKQVLCKGSELTVLYKKAGHSDRSNSLIIDGKLIGTYESIERKYGNLFVIGFEAEENQRECGGNGMNKTDEYSINLAREALEAIKISLEEYEKGHSHNTQIETVVDTTMNAQYSTIKLDVTVYHDWEAEQ